MGEEGSPGRPRAATSDQVLQGLSALTAVLLCQAYRTQPDRLAALTFWPSWGWAVGGLLMLLPTCRRNPRGLAAVVAVWLGVVLLTGPEVPGLVRWLTSRGTGPCDLRVATLNCAGGSSEAAAEVMACDPDLVLLQECPGREECEKLAAERFGPGAHCVWGLDDAILCRWPLTPVPVKPYHFVAAWVHAPARRFLVVSLRLIPPSLPVALWRGSTWRGQRELRERRGDELRSVVWTVQQGGAASIFGGDFNAPARDGIFSVVPAGYAESYAQGGRGWGDTVLNDIPVARFDQIWAGSDWAATCVTAHRTVNSDHRLVVADLRYVDGGWER